MQLRVLRSLWGVVAQDGGRRSLADALSGFAADGAYGIEASVKLATTLPDFAALMRRNRLAFVPIVFTSGPVWRGWDPFTEGAAVARARDPPALHVAALRGQLQAALSLGLDVPFATAHTGHDSMGDEAAAATFAGCDAAAAALGVALAHETHRGRCAASPWLLQRVLPWLPQLRLAADYSHFTCACEVAASELDAPLEAALAALAPRVTHVHARVGHECSPQLPDPREAASSGAEVDAFARWWRHIWDAQAAAGRHVTTVLPEYGPARYAPQHPATGAALADILRSDQRLDGCALQNRL